MRALARQHRDADLGSGRLIMALCEGLYRHRRLAPVVHEHELPRDAGAGRGLPVRLALSDRVVIMSAGPAARIIGNWKVPLARPRDIGEVKLDPAFHALHREIWEALKDEVMKGYAQTGGG